MRYHHARVVLTACLFAAAAAAQSTFDVPQFGVPQTVGLEPARFGIDAFVPRFDGLALDGLAFDGLAFDGLAGAANAAQDPQGQYEIRTLFQLHHGDFMNRMERYEPMLKIGGRFMPAQRILNEGGEFDQWDYFGDATLPWNVSTEGYLLFGLYYEARQYEFDGVRTSPGNAKLGNETLHAGGVKLGFGAFLDDNVLLEVESRPGVFTDADAGLHHNDVDFPSHAMVTFRAIDSLFFKVGVRYNQVYPEAPWLPILGVSWDITGGGSTGPLEDRGGFRIDLLLPEHLELSYWSSGSTGWLLGAEVTGAEYHVRTDLLSGPVADNQPRDNVRIQEFVTYLGLVHRWSDNFSMTGRFGAVLAGYYDLTNGHPDQHVDGQIEPGLWGEFSIGVDF